MPKYVRNEDRDRFRIVPVGRIYHIEEKKVFFGIWSRWKGMRKYGEYASSIRYFDSSEDAKKFIDELLRIEEEERRNESSGVIYYP